MATADTLRDAASREAGENRTRIAAALETPDPETDRAIVAALRSGPDPDQVLGSLDLEALAGLADRFAEALGDAPTLEQRREAWDLLDQLRSPEILRRIPAAEVPAWSDRLLRLIERSHLTVGPLFRHRVERYGSKTLFEIPVRNRLQSLSWRQTAGRVELLARGLLALDPDGEPGPVAILSENRLEMILADLACLTSGIVNVMIPANSTAEDVQFMLRHAGARTLIVSTREQLDKIRECREELPELRHLIAMDARVGRRKDVLHLEAVAARSEETPRSVLFERSEAVRIEELATLMYTSGTTGHPKGIQFSQRNLVFKRFARALAIPEIGEEDVFLCYLPLFHTFGRYLEMLASIFWGARYCMLPNPSVDALRRGMQRHRPSVFISVPKKWMELYETITAQADPMEASDDQLLEATRRVVGDRLRWGLSAAGHLDSEIFRFFQAQGVELMSGFGMTEGTGGITMTPPGAYREDSLGVALPGIELRLAEDGELLVRGPYVMMGYLDPVEGEEGLDADGWLPTGDLMEKDADGFLRLVDRKKEIYKNIKGETIAPQRIENKFRDFPSIARVFLVGDHRPYNSVLIYPNPEFAEIDFAHAAPEEVREHFRSIVASVNKFLAPFERIVDFALIDRDLDPERQELTPKGTPRRMTVERNFREVVQGLYQRTSMRLGLLELAFPNWLFQAMGLTAGDVRVDDDRIVIPSRKAELSVQLAGDGLVQVGSCLYRHKGGTFNLGALLTAPHLWLGNEALCAFVGLDLATLERPARLDPTLAWHGRPEPAETAALEGSLQDIAERPELDLSDLHVLALALAGDHEATALCALELIEDSVSDDATRLAEPARRLLGRAAACGADSIRRRAFRILVPFEKDGRFRATLDRFLAAPGELLDDDTRGALVDTDISENRLQAFIDSARVFMRKPDLSAHESAVAVSLLQFLAEYGAVHPTRYRPLRAFLVRSMRFAQRPELREAAGAAVEKLTGGFREWLRPSSRVAVDPETGREYRWEDVLAFDEEVSAPHRKRLLAAFKSTSLLREAIFLFAGNTTIRLSDIPPRGVWVRVLGQERASKTVYRATVQTRLHGSYDLAINVADEIPHEDIREEIHSLILCADAPGRPPLVEDFGGYWKDANLWSEEFISGETLDRALRRHARPSDDKRRFSQLWPFLAWSSLAAYVDFWNRTGRRYEIAPGKLGNVIVPSDDYHTGARLVSLAGRRRFKGLVPMLFSMRDEFVRPIEEQYQQLAGLVRWNIILSAVLEVVGQQEGLELLREATRDADDEQGRRLRGTVERFANHVEGRGFMPMRLYFAIKRFRRWLRLADSPTPQARARTLRELYETYGLEKLGNDYPAMRVRLFRQTVLRDASPALAEGLEEVIGELRQRRMAVDDLVSSVTDLRARLRLSEDEDYFLTRLSFPYLQPEDTAEFVLGEGSGHASEMVVTREDRDGNIFRIRHAMNPKEVGKLHQLFLQAKLDVRFRPEHQYLVALNPRHQIIGGIYYDVEPEGETAHLEKIVVADPFRKAGVADSLMNELVNRARAQGIKAITTGFFRPEYFYAHGFKIESRYAGLVRPLTDEG
ncbi:hypothetical protein ABI59_10255 [Acidobacteria bacterium Mor1]|nr:hypothetical protein ABI59_10255 [Acidobacteria bacterium Mor1]